MAIPNYVTIGAVQGVGVRTIGAVQEEPAAPGGFVDNTHNVLRYTLGKRVMLRNVASQKYRVFAWDATTGLAKTGDAANISAHIRKDDAASAATNDTNPAEASSTNEPGYYDFDLTQAETDAAKVSLAPKSSTANIQVVACPPVTYTVPQYSSLLGIASDGDLTKVNTLDGHTPQTGDGYAIVNSGTHGNAALKTLIDNVDNFIDTEIGDIQSKIGSPAVSLAADIAAIESQTDDIGTAGAGLTAIPWNASWDAEVQSEMQDTIEVNHLDHIFAVTYDPASKPGVADALFNELIENDGGVARYTANALEQGPSGGGGVADWTADERTAIRAILGIPGSGTTPTDPTTGILDTIRDKIDTVDDFIDTEIGTLTTRLGVPSVSIAADIAALNDISASDVWINATRTLTSVSGLTINSNVTAINGVSTSAVTGVNANIGTTQPVMFTGTGSSAKVKVDVLAWGSVTNAVLLDDNNVALVSVRSFYDAVGGTSSFLENSAGGSIDFGVLSTITNEFSLINSAIDNIPTNAELATALAAADDAVLAQIALLSTKIDTVDDFIDTEVALILSRIGVPSVSLAADIVALNDISTSEVNAQVLDVLNVDTFAEPTGIPAATATLTNKIGRLYKVLMRGLETDANEKRFYDASDVEEWKKNISDNGSIYTETSALAP